MKDSCADRRRDPFGVDYGNLESVAIAIPMSSGVRVWIATDHKDMRRSMQWRFRSRSN